MGGGNEGGSIHCISIKARVWLGEADRATIPDQLLSRLTANKVVEAPAPHGGSGGGADGTQMGDACVPKLWGGVIRCNSMTSIAAGLFPFSFLSGPVPLWGRPVLP